MISLRVWIDMPASHTKKSVKTLSIFINLKAQSYMLNSYICVRIYIQIYSPIKHRISWILSAFGWKYKVYSGRIRIDKMLPCGIYLSFKWIAIYLSLHIYFLNVFLLYFSHLMMGHLWQQMQLLWSLTRIDKVWQDLKSKDDKSLFSTLSHPTNAHTKSKICQINPENV